MIHRPAPLAPGAAPALLLGLFLAGAPLAQEPAPAQAPVTAPVAGLDAVLAKVRAAVGRDADHPPAQAYLCSGTGKANGLEGPLILAFDGHGRHRLEVDTALPEAFAYDGEEVTVRDLKGVAHVVELEDRDTWRLLPWIFTGYWLDARAPLELRVVDPAPEDGPALDAWLRDTPLIARIGLDPATSLPRTVTLNSDSTGTVWRLSDWQPLEDGKPWQLPRAIVARSAESLESSFRVERVSLQDLATAYALKLTPPDDSTFAADVAPELEVQRVGNGLHVHPVVDGQDVGWFILDTGAGAMCIDTAVADRLGLEPVGEVTAVGVVGRTTASFRRGKSFALGPWTLKDPLYVTLDLSFLKPLLGHEVAGIVGTDLFERAVVEIEPARPLVAVHDPAGFQLPGDPWQTLHIDDGLPYVEGSFEGDRRGLFKLDTGADGTVTFHSPAVKQLKLLEGRDVTDRQVGGIGGNATSKEGRLEWFTLGGHRFDGPLVTFSETDQGAFADRYALGNVGQDFLTPFRIVIDEANHRIAFLPAGGESGG